MGKIITDNIEIDFERTGKFTPIALDLLKGHANLGPMVNRFFTPSDAQYWVNQRSVHPTPRQTLVDALRRQYKGLAVQSEVTQNIDALNRETTFTVTTGHQLCLFTGPLYFVIKIAHTIRLAREMELHAKDTRVVPVFWMASEDHDFEEVNHTYIQGKSIRWNRSHNGEPVGQLDLDNFETVWQQLSDILPDGPKASELKKFLQKHYLPSYTLAQATRSLVNALFGSYGLVIIDGDDPELKSHFMPHVERELTQSFAQHAVLEQNQKLELNYTIQVNPRPINLFWFEGGYRYRVDVGPVFLKGEESIPLDSAKFSPDRFSPNVLLRPLYQETILPNLAYVGGAGEIAYWLQLKGMFDVSGVPFPALALRNSGVVIDEVDHNRWLDWGFKTTELFLSPADLSKSIAAKAGSEVLEKLEKSQDEIEQKTIQLARDLSKLSPGLARHLEAKMAKERHFQQSLQRKIIREFKIREESLITKAEQIRSSYFPGNGSLQERKENIFGLVYRYGFELIDEIVSHISIEPGTFSVWVASNTKK
ncbi:MAG TPA: bacillithiol biosynthesis cysteine-adding enzyme BshC [Luteibaculaceae bacterium]|nr:bacillithiol biosynthesis cysteine-adding enzyme BshC [Luteibaculaceae bacterium]